MKKTSTLCVLLLCAIGVIPAAAESPQGLHASRVSQAARVFPLEHPVYRYLELAYREAGRVLPETVFPANGQQLGFYADLLPEFSAGSAGAYYMTEIRSLLSGSDGPGPLLSEPDTGLELEFVPLLNFEYRLDDARPSYRVLDRPEDVLRLESRTTMGPLYAEIDFIIRQEPNHGYLDGESRSNLPSEINYTDFNFPDRAIMATGGRHWSAQIGRDRLSWGTSRSGSLTYGGPDHYLDYARLSTFFRRFSYTGLFLRLEPFARASELPASGPYRPPYLEGTNPADQYRLWRKSIVTHRFTFVPHNSLRLSLMESTAVGGYTPDLRMFNPFMILHNYFDFTLMSFATSAEVTWIPLKGLELYGQWYMNDFLLQAEADAGAQEPNAMAWLGGLHYQKSLVPIELNGLDRMFPLFSIGIEGYYADPYAYIRESVLRSFTYRQRVHTNYSPGTGEYRLGVIDWHDGFLGSPYGNDSAAWLVFACLDLDPLARLDLEYSEHRDGELGPADILTPGPEAVQLEGPSGMVELQRQLTVRLGLSSHGFQALQQILGSAVLGLDFTGRLQWLENTAHVAGDSDFRSGLGIGMGIEWRR